MTKNKYKLNYLMLRYLGTLLGSLTAVLHVTSSNSRDTLVNYVCDNVHAIANLLESIDANIADLLEGCACDADNIANTGDL
jgi:hypothetical protein